MKNCLLSFILIFSFCFGEEEVSLVLTLPEAISRALNDNRQYLETGNLVTQAKYNIELADSDFNIQITPNGRAGYVGGGKVGSGASFGTGVEVSKKFTTGTELSLAPLILKFPHHYHTEMRAVLTQPLLRGLGKEYQFSQVLSSKFNLRSAYRTLYSAQVKLILRTIQALYEVVKAEQSYLLNLESHERITRFFHAAKLKEKIGLADALDVYRAEIEWRIAEETLTASHERLQESQDVVRDILSLPFDLPITVDLPLLYTPQQIPLKEAVELAMKHRIEISQAEDQFQENNRLSYVAKKNLLPELNLVLNYTNCGIDEVFTEACTRNRESTWGIGFTTSSNFNGLAEQFSYQRSLIDVMSAKREIEQTQTVITLEVRKVLRQLERICQRIQLQKEQIHTAQGELHLAQIKFDRGLADNFNVIQAEKALCSAQQAYWSALVEHIVSEFQLLASMGLLIDKPRIP
jgi:outer membrane protein